ncbi:MAG: hypothetical protein ACE5D1_00145 [Fidelibacterota bacterium]
MEKNKKQPVRLPSFHDPVKRYLAERRRSHLDGMALPLITIELPSFSAEDQALIQKLGRQITQIGLS